MSPLATRVNELLSHLDEDDYNKVISYIEFLSKNKGKEAKAHSKQEVDSIVDSLTGVLADDGKSLQEYREERLAKYETIN